MRTHTGRARRSRRRHCRRRPAMTDTTKCNRKRWKLNYVTRRKNCLHTESFRELEPISYRPSHLYSAPIPIDLPAPYLPADTGQWWAVKMHLAVFVISTQSSPSVCLFVLHYRHHCIQTEAIIGFSRPFPNADYDDGQHEDTHTPTHSHILAAI